MRQLLQRLDSGETYLQPSPTPEPRAGEILVSSRASLVSAGTERMLVDFGRSGLLSKARQQPEKVRQVLTRARSEGVVATLEAVRSKLGHPLGLGYCQAGVVLDCGSEVAGFAPGDAVVTNGPHAEQVVVSRLLAARIPDGVSFESAAFTPLAAIGLQGVRLARPELGETVVVYGLGLVGLLTVQILRAMGCRVVGVDLHPQRLALAERFGALPVDGGVQDVPAAVRAHTDGLGADAALLTLSASSDEPVHLATQALRKRGRLVLVGVTGLGLRREDFYEKEISFQVSCSYGPGRYDPDYEERGRDYPLPFVRWTEQRNFRAVLQLMADGALDVEPLVSHRLPFGDAPQGYDLLSSQETLGIVFQYAPEEADRRVPTVALASTPAIRSTGDRPSLAVIGAGNFAVRTLLPLLDRKEARFHTLVSRGGKDASIAASRFGFEQVSTDVDAVMQDPEVDAVLILTRHDSHGSLVLAALDAGKHVFVEKPLALTAAEVREAVQVAERRGLVLMVGFNRRFAPLGQDVKTRLRGRTGPLVTLMTVNAGHIPRGHWAHDPGAGGGRIVGEACHWIDLARFWTGSPISGCRVAAARDPGGRPIDDVASIHVEFADGSLAVVNYLANGSPQVPKERMECFFDGRTLSVENWRELRTWDRVLPTFRLPGRPEKGHREEMRAFVEAVRRGDPPPIPLDEILEVSLAAITAGEQARDGA